MARKHPKHGSYEDLQIEADIPAEPVTCWLCGRPTGKTIVWHHPVPKSRGGRDVVPMHALCQQTLIASFTNAELQRHGMDVEGLLANPNLRKFVDCVANKDPDSPRPSPRSSADGNTPLAEIPPPLRVAALYKFAPLNDCEALRRDLARLCCAAGVKGTLLLASEGINGTIAGSENAIESAVAFIRGLPGFADLEVKYSAAETMPFHRMKVRVKREIVTMGQPHIDPISGTGHYVSPQDWNALISDPGTIVIDTRNDYEVAVGSFTGAIDPGTASFRDFPAWFRAERGRLLGNDGRPPKIAMFCTGGIRCEKSTAFLKAEGIDEVYHLQGGILKYLETIPADQSLWEGECFVFDQRVAVGHGLEAGTHVLCHGCRRPVSDGDCSSPRYVAGVSCPACHAERSDTQRAGYAERDRQERLAQARGTAHIGAQQCDG